MLGKKKCKILKEIRAQIAEANDIAYVVEECKHQGNCRGTCPKCEQEVLYLEQELEKRRQLGKKVAVAGIAGTLAVSMTGILSGGQAKAEENQPDGTNSSEYYQEQNQTDGTNSTEYYQEQNQTDTSEEIPRPTEGAAPIPREPEDIEDLEGEAPQKVDTTQDIEKSTETETTEELEGDVATAPVQLG